MHPIGLYLAAAEIERRRGDDRRDRRVVFAAMEALRLDQALRPSRRERLIKGLRSLVASGARVASRTGAPLQGAERSGSGADTRI